MPKAKPMSLPFDVAKSPAENVGANDMVAAQPSSMAYFFDVVSADSSCAIPQKEASNKLAKMVSLFISVYFFNFTITKKRKKNETTKSFGFFEYYYQTPQQKKEYVHFLGCLAWWSNSNLSKKK